MEKKLVILGAGGYGNTVKDVAEQLGYEIIAILDDADPSHPLSSFIDFIGERVEFIPALGNNQFRFQWCDRITQTGGKLVTLIHPTAYVSPRASIAPGTAILPHAIINTDVVVEKGSILNLGSIVGHGCIIEEGVHVCLSEIVKGENQIQRLTKIEAGQIVERGEYPL